MNVEQMSTADLLRESKQAMALAMGSVGPDTRARWNAVMAEIDTRLAVGDIDEDDLEGRVREAVLAAKVAVADKNQALRELAIALERVSHNATNLQFVQEAFNTGHPALKGMLGNDLSHGAYVLWAWAKENGRV